ncbi:MAG: pknB [Frankiales bacterium]|nr:pknB [Frankiales bacterium]
MTEIIVPWVAPWAEAWLPAFLLAAGLTLGALVTLALGHLLGEAWLAPLRPSLVAMARAAPVLLRLALPLLLVVLVALVAKAFLSGGGRSTEVPEVRAGSSAVEVASLLEDAGLDSAWRSEEDPEVPEGRVVRTAPAGGTRVQAGSTVTVYTSGVDPVGRPVQEVRDSLERRGLTFRTVEDGDGGPAGTVQRLEPEGPLVPGEVVVVHVVPGGERS